MPVYTAAIGLRNKGFRDTDIGKVLNTSACLESFNACDFLSKLPNEFRDFDPYSVRIKCEKRPLCLDLNYVGDCLNSVDVQAQLGVGGTKGSCSLV